MGINNKIKKMLFLIPFTCIISMLIFVRNRIKQGMDINKVFRFFAIGISASILLLIAITIVNLTISGSVICPIMQLILLVIWNYSISVLWQKLN